MKTAKEHHYRIKMDRLGFLMAFLLFFVLMMSFNGYSNDDAFISFRYAENLSNGYGLTFNPNEPPVEGYTNFLWTLILGLVAMVKLPIPETAAFFSSVFATLLVFLMGIWAFRQKLFIPQNPVSLPVLIIAATPTFSLWATTGLETTFFTFLIVAASLVTASEQRRNSLGIFSGLIWSLCVLTRPEGIFFALTISIFSFLESYEPGRRIIAIIQRAGLPIFVFIGQLFWRHYYYGQWLPNTFYAKTGSVSAMIPHGLHYFLTFLIYGGGTLTLVALLAVFIKPRVEGIFTVVITSVLYFTYTILVGGDWMPGFRFYAPLLPLLIIAASITIVKFNHNFPKFSYLVAFLVMSHLLFGGLIYERSQIKGSTLALLMGEEPQPDVLMELGIHLREIADPYARIAVLPAGKVPYYSGLKTIDMRGLCDTHIAHLPLTENKMTMPGHHKRDPDYVLSKSPDYIILTGAIRKENTPLETDDQQPVLIDRLDIMRNPEFIKCYEPIRKSVVLGDKDLFYFKRICPKKVSLPENIETSGI